MWGGIWECSLYLPLNTQFFSEPKTSLKSLLRNLYTPIYVCIQNVYVCIVCTFPCLETNPTQRQFLPWKEIDVTLDEGLLPSENTPKGSELHSQGEQGHFLLICSSRHFCA